MTSDATPSVPPPVPAEPPARKGMSTGKILLLVALGGFALFCIPGMIGTCAVVVPQMQERQRRLQCAQDLSQLGGLWVATRTSAPDAAYVPGPALFLGWRKERAPIREGEEAVLLCDDDPLAVDLTLPGARAAFDEVDLTRAPRALCSYAVRDFATFPLDARSGTPAAIAACVHHRRGATVLFDTGSVRFIPIEELGVSSPDELVVGPGAPSPLLRELRYGDGSVR